MKAKIYNEAFVVGYLYDSNLKIKKVEKKDSKNYGMTFITGDISVATDEDMTNVVTVKYRYAPQAWGDKPNNNFNILKNIVDGRIATFMNSDKEHCAKIQVKSAVGLNEFPDNRTGEWVSNKVLDGGFISTIAELPEKQPWATFNCDMVITGVTRQEANEDRGTPEKMILRGGIFDFRKAILPIEFSVLNEKAMEYFESLDISKKNPCFTKVQGKIISQTVTRKTEEEGAFGEPVVRETKSSHRDYVVTWAQSEPYTWDSPESILASELAEKIQEREIYLATEKKRQEDWRKENAAPKVSGVTIDADDDDDFLKNF